MNEQSYMTNLQFIIESSNETHPRELTRGEFNYAMDVLRDYYIARESSSIDNPSYITHCLWEDEYIYGTDPNFNGPNPYYDPDWREDEDPYAEARREYERDIMADFKRQGLL